ncbi:MAG: hypothetical protein Q4B09_04290 [Lachnospiraceae bacterium]|nr:hypothetical protein [Lachnospiraceae bacterium]
MDFNLAYITGLSDTDRRLLAKQTAAAFVLPAAGVSAHEAFLFLQPALDPVCSLEDEKAFLQLCMDGLRDKLFQAEQTEELSAQESTAISFFCEVLQALYEREFRELPFEPLRGFCPLTEEELAESASASEYKKLQQLLYKEGLYVLLRLSDELTEFRVLAHTAAVHHIAMNLLRQLTHTDIKADPALVSGAAVLHDLGKLGCPEDSNVLFLHYYYTWQLASLHEIGRIGDLAANHSVWDLEPANLSLEGLLLIYADFRVKNTKKSTGEEVRICTLNESYEIILQRLGTLSDEERSHYTQVYTRIRDFEEYLLSEGCRVDFTDANGVLASPSFGEPAAHIPAAVMTSEDIAHEYRRLAISSNLHVMHHMNESNFIEILENIRSEKNWQLIRSYLTVLGEYSSYINQAQKDVTLRVLYDLLFHMDGDIRRQAGTVAGLIISDYEISFRKETPDGRPAPQIGATMGEVWKAFLHKMLFPGPMLPEQHRRWIGYSMKTVLRVLLEHTEGGRQREVLRIFMEYFKSTRWDTLTCFFLINAANDIPYAMCNDQQRHLVFRFVRSFLTSEDTEIRTAALQLLDSWISEGGMPDSGLLERLLSAAEAADAPEKTPDTAASATENDAAYGVEAESMPLCIRYLLHKIRHTLNPSAGLQLSDYNTVTLYLENQKAEIPWIYKMVNLEILKEKAAHNELLDIYQYVSHLLHLLQFTDRVVCKLQAGRDLVAIMPSLTEAQKQEVFLELLSAVELGEYNTTRYLPAYLGSIFLTLPADSHAGYLERFRSMIDSKNPRIVISTIATLGIILQQLPALAEEQPEMKDEFDRTIRALEGMLFCGIVDYRREVSQEAFYVIGHDLFGSASLSQEVKKRFFADMGRRILALMNWQHVELFYYNAAGLNHIYRFLTTCMLQEQTVPDCGDFRRAAFFPGTFDPFSMGHRAIVKEIAALGFTVFLAVDEFSWSKRTQPYRIRRKIAAMSTADLMNVYLFPAAIPVNIANPEDMRRLRKFFGDREVYLVAGSDVVENASAYRMPPEEGSVHSFPHILFARNEDVSSAERASSGRIDAEIIRLKLPTYFETMSSTRIRENVSVGKDIGNLVERRVQNYIYDHNLYSMEPMYKKAAHCREVDCSVETVREESGRQIRCLKLHESSQEDSACCGHVTFHGTDVSGLFAECGDVDLAQRLRRCMSGRIAVLHELDGTEGPSWDFRLTALNEAMALCQEEGFSYAVCFNGAALSEVLTLTGFRSLESDPDCFIVDMRKPLVLLNETQDAIQEPLSMIGSVRREIWQAHKRFLKAVSDLYAGSLVLSFDSDILNHRMIRMIAEHNSFPEVQYTIKKLGEKMCVPFSKILKGVLIPECVTKDLNTEKLYDTDLRSFEICSFPKDADLDVQIRTIRSFRKPVILVDDIYHKGTRMKVIEPYLQAENIPIDRLQVGVLSGRGRDLAGLQNRTIDSVYFVPNMRCWMIESEMYPFIGGDGIRRDSEPVTEQANLLPSINQTLPYQIPPYLEDASMDAFFRLSEVCIENAAAIYRVLELEYQKRFGRKLTVERLSEAIAVPRVPDGVITDPASVKEAPSELLRRELSRLMRLRHLLDVRFRFDERREENP